MKEFNFRKTIIRNDFTVIFNRVGKRRVVTDFNLPKHWKKVTKRSKLQKIRRAHQGSKNMLIGRIHALKVKLQFGRHKTRSVFRR